MVRKRRLAGGAAMSVLALGALAGPAAAAISPVTTDDAGALSLAQSIAADPAQVTGAHFEAITAPGASDVPGHDTGPDQSGPVAIFDSPLGSFPTNGSDAGLLTTGDPWYADQPNDSDSTGRDNGGDPPAGRGDTAFDVTTLRIDLDVPSSANCIALQYRFLSDEFPEFVGTEFNDAFIAELNTSDWTTSGSVISAPRDFATNTNTGGVSVNSVGPVAVFAEEAAGTTYDAATGLVTTKTPIAPGANKLYLSIFDQGDHIYDAAVMVDNLTLLNESATTCRPPHIEPPPPPPPPAPPAQQAPPAPPPPPSNVFTVGGGVTYKNGATTMTVNVPGPGTVDASQAGSSASRADAAKKRKKKHKKAAPLIRRAHVVATKAGPVKLTIKPSSAGRKVLRKRGKFTVKVQIKFTPAGGTPRTSVKKVTIKLKPKKHRKHHR